MASTNKDDSVTEYLKFNLEQLNRSVLLTIVDAAQNGQQQILEQMGVDAETAAALRKLPLDALNRGRSFRATIMDIKIHPKKFQLYLRHIATETDVEETIDLAVKLGFRQTMLYRLCGLSRRDYDIRRKAQGLPPHATGRIQSLNEEEEIRVIEMWMFYSDQNKEDSILKRLVRIAETTGYRAQAIWNALEAAGIDWE